MSPTLIIISVLIYLLSLYLSIKKQIIAPIVSFTALLTMWLSDSLPINTTIITGWLAMTLIVTIATTMQPVAVREQTRGSGYMLMGALTGMTLGLMLYGIATDISMFYGLMMSGTIVGTAIGFHLFTRTPAGCAVSLKSGYYFKYLAAKGFPTAITVMQLGIIFVLLIAVNSKNATL